MKTLEAKLKVRVAAHLKHIGAWYHMPVPSGWGRQAVDFLCCVPYTARGGPETSVRTGRFLAIEIKAPGGKPTPRQRACMEAVIRAGGAAFCCDSYEGYLMSLCTWGFVNQP